MRKPACFFGCGVLALLAPILSGACSTFPDYGELTCRPDAPFTDPGCIDAGSDGSAADAGTDADTDAGNTIGEIPGFDPSSWSPVCPGACVPEPSDTSAGTWPNESLLVWMGPRSEMPEECPPEVPFMKWKRFGDLVAPPANCEACSCESSGTCTGLPASIEIRNAACNADNFQSIPFNGPANWDGSCTSANAIAAGTLCNGVPCAQSVYASTLPAPTNESCTPTNEKPAATTEHQWLEGALACRVKDLTGTCSSSPDHCVQTLPEPWLHCVAVAGIRDVCPGNYELGPYVRYAEEPIDDRGCSDCSCGSPTGICVGSLRVYSDATCGNQFLQIPLASLDVSCGSVLPPGRSVGSKAITDLAYVPGMCAVNGGIPIGAAIPNSMGMTEATTPVTFCCRSRQDTEPKPIGVPS